MDSGAQSPTLPGWRFASRQAGHAAIFPRYCRDGLAAAQTWGNEAVEAQIRPIHRTEFAHRPARARGAGSFISAVAASVLCLVVCGSLTPFDFDPAGGFTFATLKLDQLTWDMPGRADLAANFLVYLPVGFTLLLAMRTWLSAGAAWFMVTLAGACLSLAVEITQTFLASRYAAWFDVLLNACGGLAGASIALLIHKWLARCAIEIQAQWRLRPMQTLASALTFAVVVAAVAPFEFVTSTAGLHEAFRDARVPLPVVVHAGRLVPGLSQHLAVTASRFDSVDLATLLVFAALGAVLLLAGRERGCRTGPAIVAAAASGWILAVAVESMQLFSVAHAFDMLDLVTEGASATAGALLAAGLTRSGHAGFARRLDWRRTPIGATAAVWCACAAMVLALSAGHPDYSISRLARADFNWTPFAEHFPRSLDMALWSMLEVIGACAVLTACSYWFARRLSAHAVVPVTFGVVLLVAGVGEGLHAAGPANTASISNLILAAIAAWLTLHAVRMLDTARSTEVEPTP